MTIFTIPKPFVGHIGTIQRNALRNWLALRPACEIVVVGDETGVRSCAHDLGVTLVEGVARNEFGTPLLSSAFQRVAELARFPVLCYVNADIIFPEAFPQCVALIPFSKFLMAGRRVDVDVTDDDLVLADEAWAAAVERMVSTGSEHPPMGSDYFVFPKGALGELPPFAVGRPVWDNWMIFRARELKIPVIDGSPSVLVVHQNHDYEHVPGSVGDRWEGPEAIANRKLVGGMERWFTLEEATWSLTTDGVIRRGVRGRDYDRMLATLEALHPRWRRILVLAVVVLRVIRRLRRLTGAGGEGASSDWSGS